MALFTTSEIVVPTFPWHPSAASTDATKNVDATTAGIAAEIPVGSWMLRAQVALSVTVHSMQGYFYFHTNMFGGDPRQEDFYPPTEDAVDGNTFVMDMSVFYDCGATLSSTTVPFELTVFKAPGCDITINSMTVAVDYADEEPHCLADFELATESDAIAELRVDHLQELLEIDGQPSSNFAVLAGTTPLSDSVWPSNYFQQANEAGDYSIWANPYSGEWVPGDTKTFNGWPAFLISLEDTAPYLNLQYSSPIVINFDYLGDSDGGEGDVCYPPVCGCVLPACAPLG